jgi:hypothetical protein
MRHREPRVVRSTDEGASLTSLSPRAPAQPHPTPCRAPAGTSAPFGVPLLYSSFLSPANAPTPRNTSFTRRDTATSPPLPSVSEAGALSPVPPAAAAGTPVASGAGAAAAAGGAPGTPSTPGGAAAAGAAANQVPVVLIDGEAAAEEALQGAGAAPGGAGRGGGGGVF